jgi:hypothetical protein
MKYLLIGGCADGQWAETGGSQDWNQMKPVEMGYGDWDKVPENVEYSRYRRVPFRAGGSETFVYYCIDKVRNPTSDELSELTLHALIEGYGKRPYERDEPKPAPRMRPAEPEDLDQFLPDPDEIDRRLAMEEQRRQERLATPPRMRRFPDISDRMMYDEQHMRMRVDYSAAEKRALLELLDIPGARRELIAIVGEEMFIALLKELKADEAKHEPKPDAPPRFRIKNPFRDEHERNLRKKPQ